MWLIWSDSEQRHRGLGHGWQYPAKPWSLLHRVAYWIDCFGIPLCSTVPGIPSFWNMGLGKMNKPVLIIAPPGSHHIACGKPPLPLNKIGESLPHWQNFCLTTAQWLLKNCPAPAPAPSTVTNTTRVRQETNVLPFELERWGREGSW